MPQYHLFLDQAGRVLAVEACPQALARAPRDRLLRRMATAPVTADRANMTLSMFGGEMIHASGPATCTDGRYEFA